MRRLPLMAAVAALPLVLAGKAISMEAADTVPAYQTNCAGCHGVDLQGAFAPPLSGDAFKAKWSGKLDALKTFIANQMPPGMPGSLSAADYAAVTALVASRNGLGAGAAAETASSGGGATEGGQINETWPADGPQRAEEARRAALLKAMRPVTEAMLRSPPPGDWLNWRRTDDAQGYSPLTGINRTNAANLQLVWSLALMPGTNQMTPLVHDGVIFVNSAGSVQAIDAANGTVLWSFNRPAAVRPLGPPTTNARGMAMFGTTLYVPTIDNHMLAFNAHTGDLLWDHTIEASDGILRVTGAPIVVKGKVIQGVSGCAGAFVPGGCFIVALDAKDGRELWRFNTIARPGSKDDSWNGAPLDQRFGGSVWTGGSYDAGTGLVYFGTGQTYKISVLLNPGPAGARNDALYTDTTLALDPDTGKLVWHYQHMKREVWDLDWSFERTLATIPVKGVKRRVVMTMGKIGILDVLDAKTGQYLFSQDLGLQDLVSKIDPVTGEKTIRADAEPIAEQKRAICPFPTGIRNFQANSFDPATGTLYIAGTDTCMNFVWRPKEKDWDIAYGLIPRPGNDGQFGRVFALDVAGRKGRWTQRGRAPASSAALATAGGLVFEGARDRTFRALDSATGKMLWQTRLTGVANGFPVSFAVGGRQCVAVTTGGGGPNDAAVQSLTPEIRNPGGTNLFVFCAPGKKG